MVPPAFASPSPFGTSLRIPPQLKCLSNPFIKSYVIRSHPKYKHSYPLMTTPMPTDPLPILTYPSEPISGQKTGTSGIRRKTKLLLSQPRYIPNWVQSLFTALGGPSVLTGKTLVLGGDGRFHNKAAAQTILRQAAANGISKVVIGRDGILTTPAVSALIPSRGAIGGIILTASHNPAGIDGDWGMKYNTSNGAPAQEQLTDRIYEETKRISAYKLADLGTDVDISTEGITTYSGGVFSVEVINPVTEYAQLLQSVFDFPALYNFLSRPDFTICFDAMHAATGEYARTILEGMLGAAKGSVINGTPLEDFGGGHPDPNLTYAAGLVAKMDPAENADAPEFGAASDADGDRNMILGRGVFISPGDSVAIIADNCESCMPYFAKGLVGVARSMPTSSALDRVAAAKNVPVYETPTGWKYFTNLMNAGNISVCGEESFGTSSDHIREKDGLWAVLAWLSILESKNRVTKIGELVTVEDVLLEHWKRYGRTYNMRYDFESVASDAGDSMMEHLRGMISGSVTMDADVEKMEEFEYVDPVDGSIASRQGVRVVTKDGGRFVYRLSGTGSAGATIRIYFELYEAPKKPFAVREPREVFQAIVDTALRVARIPELTKRDSPTVIT